MSQPHEHEVPEGIAVFPVIPPDLGVNPMLLAILHAIVFLAGSEDAVVHPDAGGATIDAMAAYLQRLRGPELEKARKDLQALAEYARAEKWSAEKLDFLETFLADCGVGAETR